MVFAIVMLAMFFWLDPSFHSLVQPYVGQVENLVNTQFPVFFAAVTLALLASAFSWLMTNMPRREPASQFRVVKRYWVQQ
jgi:peptidoglycan/LPS O-acetylase OafA/YrhL